MGRIATALLGALITTSPSGASAQVPLDKLRDLQEKASTYEKLRQAAPSVGRSAKMAAEMEIACMRAKARLKLMGGGFGKGQPHDPAWILEERIMGCCTGSREAALTSILPRILAAFPIAPKSGLYKKDETVEQAIGMLAEPIEAKVKEALEDVAASGDHDLSSISATCRPLLTAK